MAEVEAARGPTDAGVARAKELLLAAEGSDWFWWYGEPFSSAEDAVFDELFRAHLEAAWRALGDEPPVEVTEPLGVPGATSSRAAPPQALIHPAIDGKADRFYDWQGASVYEIGRGGAMADSSHPVERIFVGFDEQTLYLRLDPTRRDRSSVTACTLVLRLRAGDRDQVLRIDCASSGGGPELTSRGGRLGAAQVVELSLPLSSIDARPHDELRLWLTLERDGTTFARVPRDGTIAVVVPWPGWEDENWSA